MGALILLRALKRLKPTLFTFWHVATFDERVVGRQTFLHEARVWLDELLKKHHVRRVSVERKWRRQNCSKLSSMNHLIPVKNNVIEL